MLKAIPNSPKSVILVDVAQLEANPGVRGALGLEALGLPPGILPLVSDLVDRAVIATDQEDGGVIAVLSGGLDLENLLPLAGNFGVTISGEPESYGGYEVWSGDVFGLLSVSLAEIDRSTILLSQEAITTGSASNRRIKEALDTFAEPSANQPSDTAINSLLSRTPSGLVTILSAECGVLDRKASEKNQALAKCTGVSISAAILTGDSLAVDLLLSYTDPEAATLALAEVRNLLLEGMPKDVDIQQAFLGQEGEMVRVRVTGDAAGLVPILGWLAPQ